MPNIKAHAAIKVTNSMMFVWGGYNEKGDCTDTSLLIDVGKCLGFKKQYSLIFCKII